MSIGPTMMPGKRPHVIVNVAASADGKIDTVARRGAPISSPEDWERADALRAASDAVMVGGKTLLQEDPRLTVKSARLRAERARQGKPENPMKVGVVTSANLRENSRFLHEGRAEVILFTTRRTQLAEIARLEAEGAQVLVLGETRVDLGAALTALHERGVGRLMVEGGGTLLGELFRLGLVDEFYLYIAPLIVGGSSAPTIADGPGLEREAAVELTLDNLSAQPDGSIIAHYFTR
jgi:2,5-diamino-6-(ribosylamino)-4(3H)-pyrimidinone 5'-phosphate reductase